MCSEGLLLGISSTDDMATSDKEKKSILIF